MPLSATQVAALIGKPAQSKVNCIVRTVDAELKQDYVSPKHFGAFEGRAGSLTRSRKGAVRRQPNGWRKYNGYTEVEVVAYHA